MRPHVSAETMARYRQGDLNQRRTSHVSTHLAGCDRCSALNEDLVGVTALLAGVRPPPMPEDLTARITGAIAAESARRAADPAAGDVAITRGAAAGRRHRPPRPRRAPRIAPKVALGGLAAAAAVVLVGGGIYEVIGHTGSTASSTASGMPSAARQATRSPANGPMASAPVSGPALEYQGSGRRESITPITTGANFTPAGLSTQVTAEVREYGAGLGKTNLNGEPSGGHGPASPAAVPREQTGTFADIPLASLRGCVNRIAAGSLVLLVDVAHYRGAPATIIVTEAARTGPMQIWVVGTGCSASSSDVLQRATATTP
jgi:hypothetical protein